jgi:spermidine synthase
MQLLITSFFTGFAVMAAEMSAGRMMAPYYGTSTMVWALLIGAVMTSLALGHLAGGKLSRWPTSLPWLFRLLACAALMLAVLPHAARPLMQGSLELFHHGATLTLVATGVGVAALLAAPLVLLGMASPILVHHAVSERRQTGAMAGRLYAFGTVGSLAGTFLPGVIMVSLFGSTATLRLCAGLLAGIAVAGLVRGARRSWGIVPAAAGIAALLLPAAPIKERADAVFETESAYNYIQVTDDGYQRRLYLNDGYAVQSIWRHDHQHPLCSVWGYYAAAPAWSTREPERMLLLGLGGGNSARFFADQFPKTQMIGVEIDPVVVDVARNYFGLPPSVDVHIDDARSFLRQDDDLYDIIIVDAFQFPYVPFQLTTREFLADLEDHLRDGGVVVLNVGRDRDAYAVVDAVARTAGSVFTHVEGVDVGNANTILVAAHHAPSRARGVDELGLPAPIARRLRALAPLHRWQPAAGAPILVDDHAPVELMTDTIVLGRLLGEK